MMRRLAGKTLLWGLQSVPGESIATLNEGMMPGKQQGGRSRSSSRDNCSRQPNLGHIVLRLTTCGGGQTKTQVPTASSKFVKLPFSWQLESNVSALHAY